MNQMTRIVAAPADGFKVRFTTQEYLRMCETGAFEDWTVELVDGERERLQHPQNDHAIRQAQVVMRLGQVVGEELVRGGVGVDLGMKRRKYAEIHTVRFGQQLAVPGTDSTVTLS